MLNLKPPRHTPTLRRAAVHYSVPTAEVPPVAVGPKPNALIQIRDCLEAHARGLTPRIRWCICRSVHRQPLTPLLLLPTVTPKPTAGLPSALPADGADEQALAMQIGCRRSLFGCRFLALLCLVPSIPNRL